MTDIQFQIIKEVKIILEISAPSNFGCSCRKSTTRFYKLLINSCFVPVIFDRKYYGEHVRFEVSYRAYFVPYAVKSPRWSPNEISKSSSWTSIQDFEFNPHSIIQ